MCTIGKARYIYIYIYIERERVWGKILFMYWGVLERL